MADPVKLQAQLVQLQRQLEEVAKEREALFKGAWQKQATGLLCKSRSIGTTAWANPIICCVTGAMIS